MKCTVKMGDHVSPVAGSVRHDGTLGTCPECNTPGVMLSIVGGFVRAHTVAEMAIPENNHQPATLVAELAKKVGKTLSEPVVALTDTGIRIGDPRAAEKRRMADLQGATGTGTVKVPRKVESGSKLKSGAPRMVTKMVEVPVTEKHVREALEYWRKKRITGRTPESVRRAQIENVTILARTLESLMAAQDVHYNLTTRQLETVDVPVGEQRSLSASVDAAQGHRGPTLVRGRQTTPKVRPDVPWDQPTDVRRDGTPRKRTSFEEPLGRERADRMIITVPEPAPVLSANQKRNRRRKAQRAAAIARSKG
jgi:hypothetical protein